MIIQLPSAFPIASSLCRYVDADEIKRLVSLSDSTYRLIAHSVAHSMLGGTASVSTTDARAVTREWLFATPSSVLSPGIIAIVTCLWLELASCDALDAIEPMDVFATMQVSYSRWSAIDIAHVGIAMLLAAQALSNQPTRRVDSWLLALVAGALLCRAGNVIDSRYSIVLSPDERAQVWRELTDADRVLLGVYCDTAKWGGG